MAEAGAGVRDMLEDQLKANAGRFDLWDHESCCTPIGPPRGDCRMCPGKRTQYQPLKNGQRKRMKKRKSWCVVRMCAHDLHLLVQLTASVAGGN